MGEGKDNNASDFWDSTKVARKGEGLTEKNLNDNLESPLLAPALFSHIPGF